MRVDTIDGYLEFRDSFIMLVRRLGSIEVETTSTASWDINFVLIQNLCFYVFMFYITSFFF